MGAPTFADTRSVAIIITTFNHARFLGEAITSALSQTRPADEVIVIDDGSTDDPAGVVKQFADVRLIQQRNQGLSAARNAGLRASSTTHILFLDADDRLLQSALEAGLACAATHPDCGFVYGGHRVIWSDGRRATADLYYPIVGDPYLSLLRRDLVGMHATALYRRDCVLEAGGFDESLKRREDYDLYLRIARRYPVASHPITLAEYRRHNHSMSSDCVGMLNAGLTVLDRQKPYIAGNAAALVLLKLSQADERETYVREMLIAAYGYLRARRYTSVAWMVWQALKGSPRVIIHIGSRRLRRRLYEVIMAQK